MNPFKFCIDFKLNFLQGLFTLLSLLGVQVIEELSFSTQLSSHVLQL